MRVLIDTNIVLDFLLEREPFFSEAELLFQSIATDQVIGYVSATTLTDIFYIARRHTRSIDKARRAVTSTMTAMSICPVDRSIAEAALTSGLADFEDAVQIFSAVSQNLAAIVTRDVKGFLDSPLPILSIQELLVQTKPQS